MLCGLKILLDVSFEGGINTFGYVEGNPVSYIDPRGEFAIPLLVLLPTIAGTINGIFNVLSASECDNKWSAFGSGFVAGGTGTLIGLGSTALTGNPLIGGALGGAAGDLVNQSLNGPVSSIDWGQAAWAGAFGSIGTAVSRGVARTVGRSPQLSTARNGSNWGRNSSRLVNQETINGAIGGGSGAVWSKSINPKSQSSCTCPR